MRFKLSVQSAIFRFYPLELAVQKIADAGFDGIELWGGQFHGYYLDFLTEGSSLADRRLDGEKIAFVKKLVDKAGLEIVCYTPEQCFYPINYLATDIQPFSSEENRTKSLDCFKLSIDIAAALETRKVVVTTPFWLWKKGESGGFRMMNKVETLKKAEQILKELTDYAEKRDVTLLLEPLSHLETTAVETLDETVATLDAIDSPNLQAMLDTGHINITATKLGRDPTKYLIEHVNKLNGRIAHVHIDDNFGDVDAHLVPGEGNINFKPFLNALEQNGYSGYLSIELAVFGNYPIPPTPETLIRKSRQFLINATGS